VEPHITPGKVHGTLKLKEKNPGIVEIFLFKNAPILKKNPPKF